MRRGFVIVLCFFAANAFSQAVSVDRMMWDFGDVAYWKNDTAWFHVRNASSKNLIFLPTFYNEDFRVLFSSRAVEPGQSVDVGVIFYLQDKGRFSVQVPLYINIKPDPIVFTIKGNIKGFDPSAQLKCPIVNGGADINRLEKVITIEVRDRITEEILDPDDIWVRTRDNKRVDLEHVNRFYQMKVFAGSFRIGAGKRGYEDYLALINLEPYQNHFIIYLDKKAIQPEPDPIPERIKDTFISNKRPVEVNTHTEIDSSDDWMLEEEEEHTHKDTLPEKPEIIKVKPTPDGILDKEMYTFNNIILIVDVSASMKRENKLDNLKSAVEILIDAFRVEDKVGIVSLASNATLVQVPVYVVEKDSLKNKMNSMTASGATNGGAALQMAYALAKTHYMPSGNNQIIIATDGVFSGGNLTRKDMEKMILDANAKGIHLSTIGLGADPKAMTFLQNLSAIGGGQFVQIKAAGEEKSQLLDMIKTQSHK
jgi:hypothetical protein